MLFSVKMIKNWFTRFPFTEVQITEWDFKYHRTSYFESLFILFWWAFLFFEIGIVERWQKMREKDAVKVPGTRNIAPWVPKASLLFLLICPYWMYYCNSASNSAKQALVTIKSRVRQSVACKYKTCALIFQKLYKALHLSLEGSEVCRIGF